MNKGLSKTSLLTFSLIIEPRSFKPHTLKLTNLEIKGFKSFADKTQINFNERITGVVGPNGCGKSNIVDAIRWVVGEQRASSLRSAKMENLIFAGSKKRKNSGLAEVSLTFENTKNLLSTEYNTVKVSRLYFRNGDSEYRINGVPCRLKDISNLFLDTGISSDSYAIIELAMVTDLLTDKDNSRRKLFEQAAGVSKYKKRKRETLSKLKSTQGDLDRVEDLLFEIEGNLKSLEKQARRAEKYKKIKGDYKDFSIDLAIHLLGDQKKVYAELTDRKTSEEDKRLEIEAKVKELDAQLQKEKSGNIELEQALAEVQKNLNVHVAGIQSLENSRNLMEQGKTFATNRKAALATEEEAAVDLVEKLEQSIASLATEQETAALRQSEQEQEQKKYSEALEAAREACDAARVAMDKEQNVLREAEMLFYDLEKQVAVGAGQIEHLSQNLEQNSKEISDLTKELEDTSAALKLAKSEKEEAEAIYEKALEQDGKARMEVDKLTQGLEDLQRNLADKSRNLDARRNEYDLTKSLVDNLEGYPESIKYLKKNVEPTRTAPLLSDVFACREDYKISIENYLDNLLNYYVVDDLGDAITCIRALNTAAMGRAHFFVLEELKGKQRPTLDLNMDGITPALSVIDIDDKFADLAVHLLGNVYIMDDTTGLDEEKIKAFKKDGLVLLTKSGRYIRKRFSLSGGSVGLFEGHKIGRAKNLEKLQRQIEKLEGEVSKITAAADKIGEDIFRHRALIDEEKLASLTKDYQSKNDRYITLKTKAENLENYLSGNTDKTEVNRGRIQDIESSIKSLRIQLNSLKEDKEKKTETARNSEATYQKSSDALRIASEAFNDCQIEYHKATNALNSLVQSVQFKTSELQNLRNKSNENKNLIAQLSDEILDRESKLEAMTAELGQGYDKRDLLAAETTKTEELYYSARGEIGEMEEALKLAERKRQQSDLIIGELKDKFTDLKLQLSSMRERLQIEFRVDIDELMEQEASTDLNREELGIKVEALRGRLERFGEVNPTAMEAYEVMKGRYDFISSQKQDLEDAKDSLMDTIKEIEETAKTKFLEAFDKIRENFIMVFRELFSEDDQCDLKLIDPDNPLESNIEIIAKPKGKRPQTINQLSGGEKTLTAMSLLFGIYLLKPAPFCILDEVDAPLDDNNISKFNHIVKKFSKDSQFIIVTHNKLTMSNVDIVYGVTMAEEGVSRVVPVDFRNLN